ncbi:Gfo/Idh/MocA family oxidoreductase [soil metagenome]
MSVVHARAARAVGARVVGVASRTAAGAEKARQELGAEVAFPSWRDLLADDSIDVVHICSPNQSHVEIAAAAIAAGKHVVCEKPLATTLADAAALAMIAEAHSSLVTAVPFVYRFHAMVREARARVQGGATGRIFSLHGAYLQDWLAAETDDDWRVDPAHGGPSRAFADIGSHLSDVLQFVAADPISRLSAAIRTVHENRRVHKGITSEDVVTLVFETRGGVIGTMHVSQVAMGHKNGLAIEIDGANESLVFDGEAPDTLRIGTRAGFLHRARADDISPEAARYSVLPAGHPQGYQEAFNGFVGDVYSAIGGNTPDGLPTFDDGYRAAAVTDAVLRSHAEGGWVEVAHRPSPASRPRSDADHRLVGDLT